MKAAFGYIFESRKDKLITQAMQSMLNDFFDRKLKKNPSSMTSGKFTPQKNSSMGVKECFNEINDSLKKYYKRTPPLNYTYTLKEGKTKQMLLAQLQQIKEFTTTLLQKEKTIIVDLATPGRKNQNPFKKIKQVNFEEVLTLFLQEDDKKLIQLTHCTPLELKKMKEHIYSYMLLSTRWNLLIKTIDQTSKSQNLSDKQMKKIAAELSRERVYSFDSKTPARIWKTCLAFAFGTCGSLWKNPTKQLLRMLKSEERRQIMELIPGSGKSYFGIPSSDNYAADRDNLVINIWPNPVKNITIPFIGKQAWNVFRQTANAFQFSRLVTWSSKMLSSLNLLFGRIRDQREQVNSGKEDFQSLELKFIEELLLTADSKHPDLDYNNRLISYMQVLGKIRTKGKANIDEIHEQSRQDKEQKFPSGEEKQIETPLIKVMEKALLYMITDPKSDFASLSHLGEKQNYSPIEKEVFKKKFKLLIAERFAESRELNIPKNKRKLFISYVCGKEKSIPNFGSVQKKVALVKGLLNKLIPACIEKMPYVAFCPSNKGNGEQVRPSNANLSPSESSIIQNPFEAYIKTCLYNLHSGLTSEQFSKFISLLKKSAKKESFKRGIRLPQTRIARYFLMHSKVDLFSVDDRNQAEIYEECKKNSHFVLHYTRYFIAPQITYFEKSLTSTSSNFLSMFSQFYSCTGTPYNKGCQLEGTKILEDDGTVRETLDLLRKICSKEDSIQEIKSEKPKEILQKTLDKFFTKGSKYKAIIDLGPLFMGLTNEELAEQTFKHAMKKCPEINGVVFYTSANKLVIRERGSSKAIPLSESKILPKNRITIYDNRHTYAADVKQDEEAEAVVTTGEFIELKDIEQAVWRMRGLKNKKTGEFGKESITFIYTPKLREAIFGKEKPYIDHIIKLGAKNQDQANANYHADKQKIHNVIRRAVLDKIIFSDNIPQAISVAREFRSILEKKTIVDPCILYGNPEKMSDPKLVLSNLKLHLFLCIKKSKSFSKLEKMGIQKKLDPLGKGTYPKEVPTYETKDGVQSDDLDDFGKETQVSQNTNQNTDVNIDIDLDQDQDLTQDIDTQSSSFSHHFFPWPKDLDLSNLSWMKNLVIPNIQDHLSNLKKNLEGNLITNNFFFKTITTIRSYFKKAKSVPIFRLNNALSFGSDTMSALSKQISNKILTTNNFMPLLNAQEACNNFSPGSHLQIPTFEFLVIQSAPENSFINWIEKNKNRLDSKTNILLQGILFAATFGKINSSSRYLIFKRQLNSYFRKL